MDPREIEILDANSAFYRAFGGGDLDAMEALWARRHPVACVHPGWEPLLDREGIMESWRGVLSVGVMEEITCSHAQANVLGEAAFVVCLERVDGGHLVATNVFVREDGEWRICHHQSAPGPLPEHPPPSDVVN